jgi:acyl carrier protein
MQTDSSWLQSYTNKEIAMERQELVDKMTVFLRKALANKAAEIKPDVPMRDQGLSSSGRLEFFTMCEDEWALFFEEEELDKVETFNQAVDLVLKMLSEK